MGWCPWRDDRRMRPLIVSRDLQMELNVGAFGPSRSGGDGGEHATAAADGGGGGGLLLVSKFQENVGRLVSAAWHCALRT